MTTKRFAMPALVVAILSSATFFSALAPKAPEVPEGPERPEDQTFLTFPEWFLVFSPDEYASYLGDERRSPSAFPFGGHVQQLWQSYASVIEATKPYPFNTGYHAMIVVIAASTTVEYGVKGAYEALFGRATEALRAGPTDEDRFAATVAREYVEFIKVRPWYEFDFAARLTRLWSSGPKLDANIVRALERRYALTSEYLAKAAYGVVITKATAASYAAAATTTRVTLDSLPDRGHFTAVTVVSESEAEVVADLPRYQAFAEHAQALARRGVAFRRIAGNEHAIAVSALVGGDYRVRSDSPFTLRFEQPILTMPNRKRVFLLTDVPSLSRTLRELDAPGIVLEHVYDY